VSDAPHGSRPEDTPSVEELERISVPATVRRAPRFGRVMGTGVAVGLIAGLLCGLLLPNSTGVGRFTVGLIVGLGFALVTVTVAGLVAVGLDRGTPRHVKAAKEREAASASALAAEPDAPGDADAEATGASAPPSSPSTPEDEERA